MNYKHLSQIYTDEKQFTREKLQFFFDKAFLQKDEMGLRNYYKALRNLDFSRCLDFSPETVNISTLCEDITTAFDVFASYYGKNFIYCGNATHSVYGNHHLISKAILNLLSNAYLYSTNSLVTVKTIDEADFVRVEIQNSGIYTESTHNGRGLSFVRKVCQSMNGRFFIETDLNFVKAIIFLRRADFTTPHPQNNHNFSDFITDRLSPVYIEVFGMEYH